MKKKQKREWESEKDRYEWRDRAMGLPCLIVRNHYGALCGYVAVAPGHSLWEKRHLGVDVDVHGGLTYSAHCADYICHVPKPWESDNVWWFGFDCAHGGDLIPHRYARTGFESLFDAPSARDVYRNVAFVKAEVKKLARQLSVCA